MSKIKIMKRSGESQLNETETQMVLKGVIFDLDGTLVDSALDFAAMRIDLGLPPKQPILEAVERMPPGEAKDRCLDILHEHELRGARRATLMPGVAAFLDLLHAREIKLGILTRNSERCTALTLNRLELQFDPIVTRDHAPPKPDPTGLLNICEAWGCGPQDAIYIGDYLFDIEAGQNAGMRTVFYSPGDLPDYAHLADHTLRSFDEAADLLKELQLI